MNSTELFRILVVLASFILTPRVPNAQLLEKKTLTLETADNFAATAETEAKKRNATVVIVVVDDGGYPLVLKRLDDTQVASVEVGIGKARTAAIFRRPSCEFEEQIKNGRVASLVLPGATPLQGGVPLIANGSVIKGWNAENRLIIGRGIKPGQTIQLAIFGVNGPLSNPPTNYIYMTYARLEFHKVAAGPIAVAPHEVNVEVIRLDRAIDKIVPPNPKLFKLAEGFQFTEGPVWSRAGYLLFSDPNANTIYKYTAADAKLSVFKSHSGYFGKDIAEYFQPGSNGLTVDPQGRLTINEHGNHRVTRLEKDGRLTVLADKYEGKRLNSPNDLVYRSDGTLFFTDPPFGLPKFYGDPRKKLPYSGVFALHKNQLRLVSTDLKGPNGIAFSPDEKYLYVGNWDTEKKIIMRYEVSADGTLSNGTVFFDMTQAAGEDAVDGIKVDQHGNLYVSGPGGLWIISPEAKHLGTIIPPKHPHNIAWGGDDGRTLYMTAQGSLYRMPLNIPGMRPDARIGDLSQAK